MQTSSLPKLNTKDNPTGCCPRFVPTGWDNKVIDLTLKKFVRITTRSFFYMPLNMGAMMKKTWDAITQAQADSTDEFVMLSFDMTPWKCEHYLLVKKTVPGQEMATIKGKYRTKVFEGPFQNAPKWIAEMGGGKVYLYYTTCPKCSKVYGKNYVVAFKKVA